ncbi:hypothetical protein D3C81_937680 [compost metagenome]
MLKLALLDAARVTVMVYVFVLPSAAVATTVIEFEPTLSDTVVAVPLATATPFTFNVAPASATVGVTLIELALFPTLAV